MSLEHLLVLLIVGALAGLIGERLGRGCGLLDQCGVLLSDLVHLGHGLVDLLDAGSLLLAGGAAVAGDEKLRERVRSASRCPC